MSLMLFTLQYIFNIVLHFFFIRRRDLHYVTWNKEEKNDFLFISSLEMLIFVLRMLYSSINVNFCWIGTRLKTNEDAYVVLLCFLFTYFHFFLYSEWIFFSKKKTHGLVLYHKTFVNFLTLWTFSMKDFLAL